MSQYDNDPQDVCNEVPRSGDIHHLQECIAAMADDVRANLDDLFPESGQRLVPDWARCCQIAQEVAATKCQSTKL